MIQTTDTDTSMVGNFRCEVCKDTPGLHDGRLTCFRCNGKGEHDLADRHRNKAYDKLNPELAGRARQRVESKVKATRESKCSDCGNTLDPWAISIGMSIHSDIWRCRDVWKERALVAEADVNDFIRGSR